MAEAIRQVFWQSGELHIPASRVKRREVVLALPMSRLIVKMLRVPSESIVDVVGYATPILQAMSPYPDEPLTVSCETIRETEAGRIVLAAALPESSADDIAEALDAAKLNVTRVDAIALGKVHLLLGDYASIGGETKRRLLLIGSCDDIALFVIDDDAPVAVRAISPGGDMRREIMLSLVEAENFAGARPLSEIVAIGEVSTEGLDIFAPVVSALDPQFERGILSRAADANTINALPQSWREVLDETRFKRKMTFGFGLAGAIWLLAMTVLIGVPKFYKYKVDKLNDRREQRALYNKVNAKVEQVKAVKAISNHDQGGLETLRAVVSALPPEGVELSRWNFKRNEKLTFSGTVASGEQALVLSFKDKLDALRLSQISALEEDADTPFFEDIVLPKGINSRSGKASTFDIECSFKPFEGEDE